MQFLIACLPATNSRMTHTEQQFFELLRSGLWGTEARPELFRHETDWGELFRLSKEQTLLALIFDGISTLPTALRPQRAFLINWYAQQAYIEEQNRKLNKLAIQLHRRYEAQGFTPVLLKGQGIATNYRHPLHRNSGDIDWLIGEKDYLQANEWMGGQPNVIKDHETHKHACYRVGDAEIENHRYTSHLYTPRDNRYFQRITREWFPHGCDTVCIEGDTLRVPPATYNALYTLIHAVDHFITSGLGLRQLADWTCLLHARHDRIDTPLLQKHLKRLGLMTVWQSFGCIAVDTLGLPQEEFPFYNAAMRDKAAIILNRIFLTGNMGKNNKDLKNRPKSYLSNKFFSLRYNITHQMRLLRLFPGLATKYTFYFIYIGLRQLWWDLLRNDKAVKGWE
ncbi:MAG: nucleotidyltransferase family protein [Clostridium sp.]|nr:nucleotidyltransferase family protein [Clostridium sp.]